MDHIVADLRLITTTLPSPAATHHRRNQIRAAVFRECIIRIYDTKHTRSVAYDLLLRFKDAGLYIGVRIDR